MSAVLSHVEELTDTQPSMWPKPLRIYTQDRQECLKGGPIDDTEKGCRARWALKFNIKVTESSKLRLTELKQGEQNTAEFIKHNQGYEQA